MRYTRYEYKKSSKIKFLLSVTIIIGISIGGGLYISNFIFDGKHITNNSSNNSIYSTEGNNQGKIKKFISLQCGYYAKEENAKELLTSISKYCDPFIIEEDGKYRVLAGIYKEEDGLKKMDELKSNKIDVSKINLNISINNEENKKIIEIVDGFLTIVSKLQDIEVKSIKTTEFKEWANKIINDDKIVKSEKINNFNNYVKNLPDEINKDNSKTNLQELYKLIKTY
jgi:hypothetical protein